MYRTAILAERLVQNDKESPEAPFYQQIVNLFNDGYYKNVDGEYYSIIEE